MHIKGYIEKDELYSIVDDKLKSLGITKEDYPIDSIRLAKLYKTNLQIDIIPFPTIKMGGVLYKDPDNVLSIMAINSLKSKKARNFDCMHELIHFWFHPPGERLCYDNNYIYQNKGVEWQANEGTAQALMPEWLFKEKYELFKGRIDRLSDFFCIGDIAVKYRIANLNLPKPKDTNINIYRTKKSRHCLACGNIEISCGDNYCKICGDDMFSFGVSYKWATYSQGPNTENFCPDCGITLDKNARFCIRCGTASTSNEILIAWYEESKIFKERTSCF